MSDEEVEGIRAHAEQELIVKLMAQIRAEHSDVTRAAVREGIVEAGQVLLTRENATIFWRTAFDVAKQNVKNGAGDLVIGGIGRVGRWLFWGLVLLVAMWMTVGWHGIVTIARAIYSSGGD